MRDHAQLRQRRQQHVQSEASENKNKSISVTFAGEQKGDGKEDGRGIAIEENGQRGLNLHPQAAELDREHAFILQ